MLYNLQIKAFVLIDLPENDYRVKSVFRGVEKVIPDFLFPLCY